MWKYRIFVFQPNADLANAFWTSVAPEIETERFTFTTVRLSADGLEPVTWWGANTLATEEMKLLMEEFASELVGMVYYVLNRDGVLVEAVGSEAEVGQPWTWQQALDDMGVQLIQEAVQ